MQNNKHEVRNVINRDLFGMRLSTWITVLTACSGRIVDVIHPHAPAAATQGQ